MKKKKTAHVIPHSHWDREWRYPVWTNRGLLMDFMDELLDTLEKKPEYRQFIMDGQSVIIEDYLQMRPEKRAVVEKYIKEGRITAGPWYTLPDLYPLDGECLVRNLLRGFRLSEALGKTMKVAYTSFGWGQTAQFPQIFLGFGIDFAITAKRVSEERAPKSEFWWEAPDGSKILTTRLGEGARAQFFVTTVVPARYHMKNDNSWEFQWKQSGLTYHRADTQYAQEDHFKFHDDGAFYPETIKDNALYCWECTDSSLSENERLMLCGCDFSGAVSDIDKIIEKANEQITDKQFVHSTITDYIQAFKQDMDEQGFITVKGELRDGPSSAVSGNALSTRLYLKQLNKKAQNIILRQAEPLSSAMGLMGFAYDNSLLTEAWTYMLKSHAHDSINGVTQDKTAQDVQFRLNQAIEIANTVYERALRNLIREADSSDCPRQAVPVLVFNPLPFEVSDVIKICVDVPRELDAWDLTVTDEHGAPAATQTVAIDEIRAAVHDPNSRPAPLYADRHTLYLKADNIPAGGFKLYQFEKKRGFERNFVCGPTYQRTTLGDEISAGGQTLENEFIRLEAQPNGTVNILDKESGIVYKNMHSFEDTGEVGDYWIHIPPNHNRTYTSTALPAQVWIENNGALSATMGIRTKMELPLYGVRSGCYHAAGSHRSDQTGTVQITSYLTLQKGVKYIKIRVEIENGVSDHRLRAVYPTGIKAEYSYSAGHFYVDKRPVAKRGTEYMQEMQTLPQQIFTDVSNHENGLAFVNNSLTEFELDPCGTLYLTLVRGVKNAICTERRVMVNYPEQNGGQCFGKQICEYAIYPHKGDWEQGGVYQKAQLFNIPPTAVQTFSHNRGHLKAGTSLYNIDDENVVMSAFKKAEDSDAFIMRIYNPSDKDKAVSIAVKGAKKTAYFTNLNEERGKEFNLEKPLTVPHGKIVTIEIEKETEGNE